MASRCLLTIEAEADPELPGRILAVFAQRNLLPAWFSLRHRGEDGLLIAVELVDWSGEDCDRCVHRILKIPTVIEVGRRWISRGEEVSV